MADNRIRLLNLNFNGKLSLGVTSGYYPSGGTTDDSVEVIPEIWSGKLQVKFYDTTVLSEITNNDFEGRSEIKAIKSRSEPYLPSQSMIMRKAKLFLLKFLLQV